ncbi:MAG: glycoside hydrolase family 65, partial [Spirochaetes bacterium]|nr:glycoside hydrolase family 65 [Spirochaetota bacterium]
MAIDRIGLVRRHNPVLRSFDCRCPLSVGNGEIAFTVDGTGLQTFRGTYEEGVPLCTQAQWGWHSFPTTGDEPTLRL